MDSDKLLKLLKEDADRAVENANILCESVSIERNPKTELLQTIMDTSSKLEAISKILEDSADFVRTAAENTDVENELREYAHRLAGTAMMAKLYAATAAIARDTAEEILKTYKTYEAGLTE